MVWEKVLLRRGPCIWHRVAGSGYVFILLYRLSGELRWLQGARQLAELLFTDEFKAARTPDYSYSLYEGLAGAACFLAELQNPAVAPSSSLTFTEIALFALRVSFAEVLGLTRLCFLFFLHCFLFR